MANRLKFRAYDTLKKEWAEDFVIRHKDHLVIQQYTGLKDRFGKEIYEGDIVRLFSTEDNHPILDGEIKFIYGSWRITETISLFSNDRNCEIIGNIFESAENEVK